MKRGERGAMGEAKGTSTDPSTSASPGGAGASQATSASAKRDEKRRIGGTISTSSMAFKR